MADGYVMNGPENYREAERLIEEANHVGHSDPQRADGMVTAAQVHATLALTAATITRTSLTPADRHEWMKAIDPEYAAEQAAEVTR
jgi:hypothetical protein